jgi:hypothetical protein
VGKAHIFLADIIELGVEQSEEVPQRKIDLRQS